MRKILSSFLCVAILTLFLSPLASADEVVGKIGYMSGGLIARHADGTFNILGPKSEVMAGDNLETAASSYVQVLMNDGAQMTIRPNSNLKIESYKFKKEAPTEDSAVFRLIKGGFRTVSGLIGKRGNTDAYKLKAMTATIGIRGTDFTTRLCANQECNESENTTSSQQAPLVTVGRVMLIQGELSAKDAAGKIRKLVVGSAVYDGEILSTGKASNAVVAFRDEGRVSLQEETVFHVEKFQFSRHQADVPDQENAVFRLLKGGVRVVTGLIGHVNHENFHFRLTTATIGIRGTGFDAWCNAECATGGANPGTTQQEPLKGAGVYVWAGQVALSTQTDSQLVSVGQAAILSHELKPVSVTNVPTSITENKAPRPDSVKVDMQKEFENEHSPDAKPTPPVKPTDQSTKENDTAPKTSTEPGVYVTVHDGQVIMANNGKALDVFKGQTGFANQNIPTRLPSTPAFMNTQKQFDLNENTTGMSNKTSIGPTQSGCVVK